MQGVPRGSSRVVGETEAVFVGLEVGYDGVDAGLEDGAGFRART